jgi:hypothetical protein
MLHPSEYRSLYLIATTGSIAELYRQLLHALGAPMRGSSNIEHLVPAENLIVQSPYK